LLCAAEVVVVVVLPAAAAAAQCAPRRRRRRRRRRQLRRQRQRRQQRQVSVGYSFLRFLRTGFNLAAAFKDIFFLLVRVLSKKETSIKRGEHPLAHLRKPWQNFAQSRKNDLLLK
jgi:hypothetical protein